MHADTTLVYTRKLRSTFVLGTDVQKDDVGDAISVSAFLQKELDIAKIILEEATVFW